MEYHEFFDGVSKRILNNFLKDVTCNEILSLGKDQKLIIERLIAWCMGVHLFRNTPRNLFG